MKTKNVLIASVNNFNKLAAEIPGLESLAASNKATLTALESTGDLQDDKVISEIVRRQAFAELFPRRIEARQDALIRAEKTIEDAVEQFIRAGLLPFVSALGNTIRAKVRASLKFAFQDGTSLEAAVENSDLVKQWAAISFNAGFETAPFGGPVAYAKKKLEVFAAAQKLSELVSAGA